jgi:putative thioredoxin
MSQDPFVFEVNQKSFDQLVLLNSHKIPVIVEFMGVWSGPCMAMEHVFTSLAKEFPEQFIFAKVDIDEQQELVKEHRIENVPSLMVFKGGELARKEEGELKEAEARELLKDFGIYHQSDLMREQAREKHLAGDTPGAIVLLSEAIKSDPGNTRVAMDMVQIFIDIGELDQANGLYERLPGAAKETAMGKQLNGQLSFANLASKTESSEVLKKRIADNASDYDAYFDLAVRYISEYKYSEAVDNLFEIIKQAPDYKEGAANEMVITVTNMIAPVDNDLAKEIRRKLSNILA